MRWILAFLVGAVPISAFAQTALNFDFDDNLFFTDAKIHPRNTKTGVEASLSTAEWAFARELMGKDGPWKEFAVTPETFREVSDTTPAGNHLFIDQITAAISKPGTAWQGPTWKAFVRALSNPKTRATTTLITARRHSRDATYAALQVLKEKGLIPALPEKENLFVVGDPDFPAQFQAPTIPEKKAKVMQFLLDRTDKAPVTKNARNVWGFSDDDFGNFETARKTLAGQIAARRWPHTKVVLAFTGHTHPTEKPRCEVVEKAAAPRICSAEEESVTFNVP